MNFKQMSIPKIADDVTFENFIKSILETDISLENVNLNGRPGQKQEGIDIYAKKVGSKDWIGVQCKVRATNKSFTKNEIIDEVEQAKRFNPQISKYYLYTTLNRDKITQVFEREITDELTNEGLFPFQIYFWEDIIDKLEQEQHETVFHRYFHSLCKDNIALGHSIGKLVNLELTFENGKNDTHCELIFGKIPKHNDNGRCVDYYRGTYYVVNLHEKKIEFFQKKHNSNKAHCFPSDIEHAFENKIDRYRVCEWIKSIENIDDFIYNDKYNYEFSLSEEKEEKYFKDREPDDFED
jgi:hypothetical protein